MRTHALALSGGRMWSAWAFPCLVTIASLALMEVVAMLVHRHVMHGFGWSWHRSHHEPGSTTFEKNDLYALVFAALSIALFVAGRLVPILWWIALGMVGYGACYALLHDVLVHRRIHSPVHPRSGYLKRLVQAHRLHHAVRDRRGAVSFGFLYAPPVNRLVHQLRNQRRGS